MNKTMIQKLFSLALLGAVATTLSCVDQRPSRNGVFNENQYVKKSFIIRDGSTGADGTTASTDPGWLLKATVTQVSTPNPLGDLLIFPGLENGGALVRFRVTEDKLEMINMREINVNKSPSRTEEVVNAWSATNVDIKYRVNLDGETTNFLEENQELDWQQRQFVKLKLAKNDMSDLAPFGAAANDLLNKCVDLANVSATLVPDTFYTDEPNNYMQWVVEFTLPLKWDDANCVTAYGPMGLAAERLGRGNVTFRLMYSMVRAKPMEQITYKTMEVPEKDPIRHKYGWFETISISRDDDSGQLASRQLVNRFDPDQPINWYFAPEFPDQYKGVFNGPGGIAERTNKLLSDAGVKARLSFTDYKDGLKDGEKPRQVGDIRYSFVVWIADQDVQSYWAGLTPSVNDPRTGESISSTVWLNDFAIKDYYVQRIDAYLKTLGASLDVNSDGEWADGPANCMDGDTMPIVKADVVSNHNGNSSLYQKMQQYLQKPSQTYGNLGPQDFVATQDDDFYRSYYALLPYYVFSDPDANPFVIREGGGGVYGADSVWQKLQKETDFQTAAANIDQGKSPVAVVSGAVGVKETTDFLNSFRDLTTAHRDYIYAKNMSLTGMRADAADAFSFETVMARDARHCVGGKWETKQQWTDGLIKTYWSQVMWHEFGHAMGLTHNFMASLDKNNFPHYTDGAMRDHVGLNASSVMEYNAAPDRVFWGGGWAPYDEGALSFVYGNTAPTMDPPSSSISGQISANSPWKDPKGFKADGTETQYLFCNEYHMKYSPFCKQGDLGTTPSEIIANAIDAYEWQYQWRNFRTYRKFWDNSAYANTPAGMITDMRRFLSLWAFDWSSGELADTLRRIGITNPDPNGSNLEYYTQLTNKFNKEASAANQMVGAFHKAIIQQSSGERPFATIYDKFYGDTTQQGIILDKLFAMQGWVGLWPTDNYDPNQAGSYIASYTGIGDASYNYVGEDAVVSMIGGQYDVYPYFVPLAVAQFAQDTHSPSFSGRIEIRDWIGGKVFNRLQDFLDYFRDLAAQNSVCTSFDGCTYDPRPLSDTHNEFLGPDKRTWIWAYIPDRNQWVAAQKERNIATYIIVRNYTDDVINQQDDGAFPGSAYSKLLPMKYFLDSFNQYT